MIDSNSIFIGTPDAQLDDWQMQQLPDTCAVVSEMSIINQFGFDLSQDDAAFTSASHGWYKPGWGTSAADIGNMMDLYNIPNHQVMNATVADLAHELQQGHGVIVSVRSGDLWEDGPLAELLHFLTRSVGLDNSTDSPADHAVVVTGIDVSDPSTPMVILNDSGTPNGAGAAYPLDKFVDAWENSDFYYTATDIPLPNTDVQGLGSINWSALATGVAEGFAGTFAGLTYASETGDILGGINVGLEIGKMAGDLVSEFFAAPDAIDLV